MLPSTDRRVLDKTLPDLVAAGALRGLDVAGAALSMWLVACEGADKAVAVGVPVGAAVAGALEAVLKAKGKGKEIPEPADLKRKLVEEFGDKQGLMWPGATASLGHMQMLVPVERPGARRVPPYTGGQGYGGYGVAPPKASRPRLMPGPSNPCLMCGSVSHLIDECPKNTGRLSATMYRQIAASQGLPCYEGPARMKALPALPAP